ncbi:MAG: ParB N-terminal domain-containing protein [Acidimicrobiales bacterium]
MADDDFGRLRQSIVDRGVLIPIRVDEHGQVIDGHHRKMIAAELGIDCPTEVVAGLTESKKIEMASTLNRDRRHLDRQQKRALVAASIRAAPELSDRQHATTTGTSATTVGTVRRGLEADGDVSKLDTRTDAAGRAQPAVKAPSGPRRRPLPDQADRAGWEFRRAVERLERLVDDDRFPANRDAITASLQGHLDYALDVLPGVRRRVLGIEPMGEEQGVQFARLLAAEQVVIDEEVGR